MCVCVCVHQIEAPPTHNIHQIKALVQCGKLKKAYLIAIKARMVDEVITISQIAEKAGQLAVRDICEKWLLSNGFTPRK